MASTSKMFKKCVDLCPRYLTLDDTHNLCVFCLGEEHARDVFEGQFCMHCELFSMKKLRSRLSLFLRKEWQPSASHDSGPIAAEARRKIKSWGSQLDLANELERELSFDVHRPSASCWIVMMRSFWHHPIQRQVLCWTYAQEEQEMFEGEEVETEPSQSSCPVYDKLLEVMERQQYIYIYIFLP